MGQRDTQVCDESAEGRLLLDQQDQRSFEWFVNLLSQLEIEQAELGGAMER